jgi:hypothetical protein
MPPFFICLTNVPNTPRFYDLDLRGNSTADGITNLLAYLDLVRRIVSITGNPMKVVAKCKSKMLQRIKAYLNRMNFASVY